jgi:hypothetical protein
LTAFFALLRSACIKDAHKMLVKLTFRETGWGQKCQNFIKQCFGDFIASFGLNLVRIYQLLRQFKLHSQSSGSQAPRTKKCWTKFTLEKKCIIRSSSAMSNRIFLFVTLLFNSS